MSSIDLVILGMVLEKPQSAYMLQKDVESRHFARWTKVSTPSIYKKVLQLKDKGYLQSESVKGDRFAEKAVYAITEEGKKYFLQLMEHYAGQQVALLFDFNVVVANLNKLDKAQALALIGKLRMNLHTCAQTTAEYAEEYAEIPLVGRTIFTQQKLLYQALLQWLAQFEAQFNLISGAPHDL